MKCIYMYVECVYKFDIIQVYATFNHTPIIKSINNFVLTFGCWIHPEIWTVTPFFEGMVFKISANINTLSCLRLIYKLV